MNTPLQPLAAASTPAFRIRFGARAWTQQDTEEVGQALRNNETMCWNVDTQRTFMWPLVNKIVNGIRRTIGLAFDGTLSIVPNLKKLTELAQRFGIPLLSSMDAHDKDDLEAGGYYEPYSNEHGMKGAEDGPLIPETTPFGTPRSIEVSPEIDDVPSPDELHEIFGRGQSLLFQKNTWGFAEISNKVTPAIRAAVKKLDPYSPTYMQDIMALGALRDNPKAEQLVKNLKAVGIKIAFVYGVATDWCVKFAVAGLKRLGIRPIIVTDAIKAFDTSRDHLNHEPYDNVTVITTAELEKLVAANRKPVHT